jgi:hypothetical protein
MNITFVIILVAMGVAIFKWCQQSPSTSLKSVTADSLGVARKTAADTTTKASSQKPKEQKPPVGTAQGSKSNVERKGAGKPATPTHQSIPSLQLRKHGTQLTTEDMQKMLIERGFYDSVWHKDGKAITHQYEVISRSGKQLVVDHATGLTWQQSGSQERKTYEQAKAYVDSLNHENYCGYSDWRLPTLEEAMSLVEREKKNDHLHIAPVFDQTQLWIWTVNIYYNAGNAWVVYFNTGGGCGYSNFGDYRDVRAVRSGQ